MTRSTGGGQRITEKALQEAVIEMATRLGYRHFHSYDMRRSDTGWPDLVLVRPPRLLLVELKGERGKLSEQQQEWLDTLAECAGVEVYTFRPDDWRSGRIEVVLRGEGGHRR